jgi:hypothetical protein
MNAARPSDIPRGEFEVPLKMNAARPSDIPRGEFEVPLKMNAARPSDITVPIYTEPYSKRLKSLPE